MEIYPKRLEIWRIAYDLNIKINRVINTFPDYESQNVIHQMRRASTSIPINIAEGATSRFKKVFYSHLNYAFGSAKELETLLLISRDLEYIDEETFSDLHKQLDKLCAKIYGFMKYLEKNYRLRFDR